MNAEAFASLTEARVLIEQWRKRYNDHRPYSSQNYITPAMAYFWSTINWLSLTLQWLKNVGIPADLRAKIGYRKPHAKSGPVQALTLNILDRQFNPVEPNTAWTTDITYIRTHEGWLYLAVVLVLFSRRVVGWSMQSKDHPRAGTERIIDGDLATQTDSEDTGALGSGQSIHQP